jgi:hypothetical protein
MVWPMLQFLRAEGCYPDPEFFRLYLTGNANDHLLFLSIPMTDAMAACVVLVFKAPRN